MERLTVQETADRFGVTINSVYNWMKDGLPYTIEKVIGIKTRAIIDPSDVKKYQASKAVR